MSKPHRLINKGYNDKGLYVVLYDTHSAYYESEEQYLKYNKIKNN